MVVNFSVLPSRPSLTLHREIILEMEYKKSHAMPATLNTQFVLFLLLIF